MKYTSKLKLDIGNTLRKYRLEKKMSQQSVSNYLDISRQAYVNWEQNEVDFSISKLKKISDLYSLPIHLLISESYTY